MLYNEFSPTIREHLEEIDYRVACSLHLGHCRDADLADLSYFAACCVAAIHEARLSGQVAVRATRVGLEFLRTQGIRARALSTIARVANPRLAMRERDQGRAGSLFPLREGEALTLLGSGGHGVPSRRGAWRPLGEQDHPVLVVEESVVLDLGMPLDRDRDMFLGAHAFVADEDWLAGRYTLYTDGPPSCSIAHHALPRDMEFRNSSGWRLSDKTRRLLDDTLALKTPWDELAVA